MDKVKRLNKSWRFASLFFTNPDHPGFLFKKNIVFYLVFNNIVLSLIYQITIKHTHHDKANFNNQVDHEL